MAESENQMATAFTSKLAGLNSTSQSIETLSHWCVFHRKRAKSLTPVWQQQLRAAPGKRKLNFLYLANDVMQNSRKKGMEWIDAFWPIMGWAVKHTLRNTGDDKVTRSCSKLVNVWQERKIFGSRSLEGWLEGGDGGGGGGGGGVGDGAAAAGAGAGAGASGGTSGGGGGGSGGGGGGSGGGGGGTGDRHRETAVARRREERLAEVPPALTGQYAALATSLEAAQAAAAKLSKADEMCAADLRPEVYADDVVDDADDPEVVLRQLQAAESALAARRAALEESARCRTEAAQLAREVLTELEAAAEKEAGDLESSAPVAVKVATLRMKATKKAVAATAKAVAAEAAGSKNPRPPAKHSKPQQSTKAAAAAVAPPAAQEMAATDPFMVDEPYVPEDGGGSGGGSGDDEEYVPMAPPGEEQEGGETMGMDVGEGGGVGGGDGVGEEEMGLLLAQAAENPEILVEVLRGIPEEQRAAVEAQLVAAGITPPSIP